MGSRFFKTTGPFFFNHAPVRNLHIDYHLILQFRAALHQLRERETYVGFFLVLTRVENNVMSERGLNSPTDLYRAHFEGGARRVCSGADQMDSD